MLYPAISMSFDRKLIRIFWSVVRLRMKKKMCLGGGLPFYIRIISVMDPSSPFKDNEISQLITECRNSLHQGLIVRLLRPILKG
jgi:hypothetical protein